MYKIYLTYDILGKKEYRITKKPMTTCAKEKDINHILQYCCRYLTGKDAFYFRKTIISKNKYTIDFGSHTVFYEIIKEE